MYKRQNEDGTEKVYTKDGTEVQADSNIAILGTIYILISVSIILFLLIFLMYSNEIMPLYLSLIHI